ncbi:developmental regulatory protein WetA [Aspergillus homomorphus CBS 101889]|uniref:Developmental regulatory protein wetA n=1 Tax=Aspergillus homomorphus (strain CBS 101889) TaxID=1450537 RepID=A0A395I9Y6_ASPHC|nr:developmental regulatory protein weta [Aspergillus homomorphus CBS 101889]RAL16609.1 developmental regulatory protein weta [Aspergillus homomorphus CBS 101889]
MFAQTFDHTFNDLFNQYVNVDTSCADGNKDVAFSGDLDHLFQLDSLSSDCGDHSPTTSTSKQQQPSVQSWGRDFWCLAPDADGSAGQGHFSLQDTIHPSAVSDLSITLEAPPVAYPTDNRTSPSTPPATPSRKVKSALVTPKSIRRHRDPNDRRALQRKQSFSPSLTRSSQIQRSRMAYPEAWAQRFQDFAFRNAEAQLPLSPPPSDILVQQENVSADHVGLPMTHSAEALSRETELPPHYESSMFNQSPAITMPSPSAGALARQQQRFLSQSNSSTLSTSSPPSADHIFSSPLSSDPQSMPSWQSDSLASSGVPYTPEVQSHDAQTWWSPMTSQTTVQRQPSYQQMIVSPCPQRPIQSSANQHELLQGGLMIQFDPTSYDLTHPQSQSYHPTGMQSTSSGEDSRSHSHGSNSIQNSVESSSFATPQIQCTSRSPTLSPGSGSPPMVRPIMQSRGAIRTPRRNSHGRKLSANSMSAPKPATKVTSSRSPRGKALAVSFVNFTADDRNKILTGVAPSGSSKTKARREQEARDRRRQMSEAALNAVRNAGGDVEALEAILC